MSVLDNPESYAHKNLKFLRKAMDVRSTLNQFHPRSKMECLSEGRSDIVVIKRGIGLKAIFAIHNMTENKINYRLNDYELSEISRNDLCMIDHLTSNEYNFNNIRLEPFQVVWLGFLNV